MAEKNPYASDTPEWQLWENMTSQRSLSQTHASEGEAKMKMSQAAREKADRYEAALNKLKT
jgi:hypothetical protein